MNTFNIIVISQTKTLFDGHIYAVFVPTVEGEIEILKGHASLISKLMAGNMRLLTEKGEQNISIQGGFLNVEQDIVSVVVTSDT